MTKSTSSYVWYDALTSYMTRWAVYGDEKCSGKNIGPPSCI